MKDSVSVFIQVKFSYEVSMEQGGSNRAVFLPTAMPVVTIWPC